MLKHRAPASSINNFLAIIISLSRCNAFNPFGDSNANIDLNFETGNDGQTNGAEANGTGAAVAAAASAKAEQQARPFFEHFAVQPQN